MDSDVPAGPGYPAGFAVEHPETITNWKPLVQWLLAIPHFIILNALSSVSQAVAVISWFAILFTGKLPPGLAGLQHLYIRYSNRSCAYAAFMREEYPPFSYDMTGDDPGDYPAIRTELVPDLGERNRLTVAFRWILAIPHFIVLALLVLGAFFALVIDVFVVLFTGHRSAGLRDFVVGVFRWGTRLNAYVLLLTDVYPPFTLD